MKESICIRPADDEIEVMAKAVAILNKFRILGIIIRKKFVDLVIEKDPSFATQEKIQQLYSFWVGRIRDEKLNDSLEAVLQKLTVDLEVKVDRLKS